MQNAEDDFFVILHELHASDNLITLISSWNFCLNSIIVHFVMPVNIVFFVAFVPQNFDPNTTIGGGTQDLTFSGRLSM